MLKLNTAHVLVPYSVPARWFYLLLFLAFLTHGYQDKGFLGTIVDG